LAVDPSARQQAYRMLFHNVIDEEFLARIRKNTNACGVIGDNRFKDQIETMLGRADRQTRQAKTDQIKSRFDPFILCKNTRRSSSGGE
jgi:hypothetical protein